MEATQMSINEWVDNEDVIYTYSEILFSLKKEGSLVTCYEQGHMEEVWRHYAMGNKPVTKRPILHDSTYMRYLK